MPDITLSPQVQDSLTRLTNEIKTNGLLRARLLVEPVSVLQEYGLGSILGNTRQVTVDLHRAGRAVPEGQVVPFGLFHIDTGFAHNDHADGHADTHNDTVAHSDQPAVHIDLL
jgi:hypothetical protein